ncbi:NAD-dependent epimerase/dehydratase family protein [Candidatus Laterigemmans baculatus]|uniref:NAD-dependent epimerase/dehydratase family protein n=1 Tax=Candidatus Laterigemmans baculatus TaxID=2770505 RepID=UPI0013DC9460|nr:NAD-dependent epimerase/dehydratase family protein [Candidatus Laterigemmans baculatus]
MTHTSEPSPPEPSPPESSPPQASPEPSGANPPRPKRLSLITGATGLLGSYIAEQLREQGEPVRGLVRTGSDTRLLSKLGVELFEGDLRDLDSLGRATQGVDTVYHCGAFVGDWGPWQQYFEGTVETTRNVVEACRASGNPRLLHVSSISVYGQVSADRGKIDEDFPIGQHHWLWDYYGRSKVEAEQVVRAYPNHTIVRPSWIYGPRDRVSIPRLVDALRSGQLRIMGSGRNPLNMVYAGDVAAGAILAANEPAAVGQAYHLCSHGEITQRELVDLFTEGLGMPRVERHAPMPVAWSVAFLAEAAFRSLGRRTPPPFTRRGIYIMGRPTNFSIAKAAEQLGWEPRVKTREGVREALQWYLSTHPAA